MPIHEGMIVDGVKDACGAYLGGASPGCADHRLRLEVAMSMYRKSLVVDEGTQVRRGRASSFSAGRNPGTFDEDFSDYACVDSSS